MAQPHYPRSFLYKKPLVKKLTTKRMKILETLRTTIRVKDFF